MNNNFKLQLLMESVITKTDLESRELYVNYFATGDFAEKLPDFQMMEIIQYIITSLSTFDEKTNDSRFIHILLQTIYDQFF